MSRLYVIGLAAVAWLAVVAALFGLAMPEVAVHQPAGRSIALADLVVGGVPVNSDGAPLAVGSRNPFGYAPTFQQEAYADVSEPSAKQRLLAELDMTLEGVQVRAGKFTAFVNFQGERRPLRQGDRVGEYFVVAHIEQDRIRVVGNGYESRWIYLTQ